MDKGCESSLHSVRAPPSHLRYPQPQQHQRFTRHLSTPNLSTTLRNHKSIKQQNNTKITTKNTLTTRISNRKIKKNRRQVHVLRIALTVKKSINATEEQSNNKRKETAKLSLSSFAPFWAKWNADKFSNIKGLRYL